MNRGRGKGIHEKAKPAGQSIPGRCFIFTLSVLAATIIAYVVVALPTSPSYLRLNKPLFGIYSAPRVTIPQGTFIGTTLTIPNSQTVIECFLGIPYALKPCGAQRFKPPLDVGATNSTFSASKYGPICIQVSDKIADNESEDCLYLNIFRPAGAIRNQKLPVVVYIHGGSFVSGSATGRSMDRMVAWSAQPILGVSINYRLGALGFLPSGLTARAGVLNLGLQDQVVALKWIKQNIEGFGGDSNRITIMGDSAGAHSVGHHLQGPSSEGLFHQAIMESGAATARFCQPPTTSLNEQQFKDFMDAVGIDPSKLSDDIVMSSLRALPITTIKTASTKVYNSYFQSDRWAFQPTIDGQGGMITSAPFTIWASGRWNKVPILTGFCTDEGAPFVPYSINTSQEFTDFFMVLNPKWTITDVNTISKLYPDPLTDPSSPYKQTQHGPGIQHNRIMAAYGQFAYIAPVRQSAHYAAALSTDPPVYLYQFKINSSVIGGTSHACAGGYVAYDANVVEISPSQKTLAAAVNAYWTNFVANGDPNVGKSDAVMDTWPRYVPGGKSPNKIVFGMGNDERVGGKNIGILTENVTETAFVTESNFWWEKTLLTEN